MTRVVARHLKSIEAVFPDEILNIEVHDQGDDFLVIEINQAWMFRFCRNPAARQALDIEKRFLPRFFPRSPITIPSYKYVGEGFVGYAKINGQLLTSQFSNQLPPSARGRIARQIGLFLSALHTFPVREARIMGLTDGWGGWRQKARQRFIHEAAPLLTPRVRQNAIEFLERFFELKWQPMVIHGDFYPADHVFIDSTGQRLCGVIDFGDLTIEDAATDFQSIYEDFGEGFYQEVLKHYACPVDDRFNQRIQTRLRACHLFNAAYAIEYGHPDRLKQTLIDIESHFC